MSAAETYFPPAATSFDVHDNRGDMVLKVMDELMSQPACGICGRQFEPTADALDTCARCSAEATERLESELVKPVPVDMTI